MAVAAYEQINYYEQQPETDYLIAVPEDTSTGGHAEILGARDVDYEAFSQARFRRWLGSITSQENVESGSVEIDNDSDTNLLDALRRANAGSTEALKMVSKNIATATSEACFKEDHITKVSTYLNDAGERTQFGQTTLNIHSNAITMRPNRHEKLQEITRAEALNDHRIEDAYKAGKLEDCYFVVASIVPEGVPEDDLGPKGDGYFLDRLTFVIQATTKDANDEITTESAFMAGVEANEDCSFEDRLAKRHDIQVLSKVYERCGQKSPNTAVGFLDNGLYIPKSIMPNGVVDLMRWCHEAVDKVLKRNVERRPEDYIALIEESRKREASLEETRQKILNELLSFSNKLVKPMDTVRLLWQLVRKHTVEASFTNTNIDPIVFGSAAAPYIMQVRRHLEHDTEGLVQILMQKAHEESVISGCGGGSSSDEDSIYEVSTLKKSVDKDKYGPLEFTCPKGHTNIRPRNKLISHCQKCGISVEC